MSSRYSRSNSRYASFIDGGCCACTVAQHLADRALTQSFLCQLVGCPPRAGAHTTSGTGSGGGGGRIRRSSAGHCARYGTWGHIDARCSPSRATHARTHSNGGAREPVDDSTFGSTGDSRQGGSGGNADLPLRRARTPENPDPSLPEK